MKIISDTKVLRAKNDEVTSDEASKIISLLEKALHFSALSGKPGVGLAAPQIGINKKVAIIRASQGSEKYHINLCNAQITQMYEPFIFEGEGCLSIDGKQASTTRYREIYVNGNLVEPKEFIATGFLSVIIQHEIDHLNGILFTDRIYSEIKSGDPCPCGKKDKKNIPIKYKKCCGA